MSIAVWLKRKEMRHTEPQRICLVSPGHLSTNPRLVKEADALVAAGYQVSVVAARFIPWADAADIEFATRPWQVHKVPFGPMAGRVSYLAQSLMRQACLLGYKLFGLWPERAFHPVAYNLAKAACAVTADLYIAHNLAALPAAFQAAKKHGARLGFDAEDFHSGEMNDVLTNLVRLRITRDIESRYLLRCDHLTAASPGIARAYAEAYGIQLPNVILNVFPKTNAPHAPSTSGLVQPSPSLYWFSQTIGPERGLEDVVAAIALSRSRPHLYLRGNLAAGFRQVLTTLAAARGIGDHLHFLAPALPDDMVRLAAAYDVGLATEVSSTINRDICLTNKIFTYLLAGIPVLATDTTAQAEIAKEMPDVMFMYPQQDSDAMARKMDELLLSPQEFSSARVLAWKEGQKKYNWDEEKIIFLDLIKSVLDEREITNKAK
jgi:glycosyltransferase involved in cell wall biosynthesis